MKYLALAISINNEVPSYNFGLMEEIVQYFVSKEYTIGLINDKTTRPRGFYVFQTNQEKFSSLEEFHKFLDSFKGHIEVLDVEQSEIAKALKLTKKGSFAIRLRWTL